jgi:hypothetical protein
LPLLNALDPEIEINGPIIIAEAGFHMRSLGADFKGENLAYENDVRFPSEPGRGKGRPLRAEGCCKGTKPCHPESGYA